MKKLIVLMMFLMCLIPSIASAHADLESSEPQEGETVTHSTDTLTLQFGEDVEKFISFTLTNSDGKTFPIDSTNISGKTVLILTKDSLPDGDYTAKWELVAEDGHENGGELSFKVGQAVDKQTNSDTTTETATKNNTTERTESHTTLYISAIVILFIIIAIGALTIFRKKEK